MHAVFGLFPKSAIDVTVSTTFPLSNDITETPEKFSNAAKTTAFFGVIDRVEMHVAIAVGASVQPLTVITPDSNIIAISVIGSFIN